MYSISPVNSWKYCDCENNNLSAVRSMKKNFSSENKLVGKENSTCNIYNRKQQKPIGKFVRVTFCVVRKCGII